MSPHIYTSTLPDVRVYSRSLFTHVLAFSDPNKVGLFPAAFPAITDAATSTTLSRGALKHAALSFAHGISNHSRLIPVSRGATLLLYAPNSLAFPVVLLGAVAAGLRFSPANTAYVPRELQHQYTNSGAGIVVTSYEGLPVVLEMFHALRVPEYEVSRRIIVIGPGLQWAGGPAVDIQVPYLTLEELLRMGAREKEESFDGKDADETCFICYSSGTTGQPKGVETTHRNLTTALDLSAAVFKINHPNDRLLGVLPFYHIYGAVAIILVPLLVGLPIVVQPRFDPESFCAVIEKFKISITMVVPPVLVVLARHPAVDRYNLGSLRIAFSAAAPLGKDLIVQVVERLKTKGIEISVMQGYGLTETSPTAIILPSSASAHKPGSIGILLPNLEARLVASSEEGEAELDAKEGEPGELWLRGPTIMKGYLENKRATLECINEEGWFKTGDVGVRDTDGFWWIVGRRKELIKYKGFQVPPSELESVLLTHPEIADAAVVGVDDPLEATELPRAYIVHVNTSLKDKGKEKEAFEASVKKWMEKRVANHKFLRGGVVVVDEIPKSAAGKILRRVLDERAKKELAGVRARL